jgi:hypothetical protein
MACFSFIEGSTTPSASTRLSATNRPPNSRRNRPSLLKRPRNQPSPQTVHESG